MELILSGSEITTKYKEPVENEVNEDGNVTPLTDLSKTVIKTIVNGTEVGSVDVVASALTGGGSIEEKVIVPVIGKREADVEIQVTAVDTSGNVSAPVSQSIRIDRLSPKPIE